MNKGKTIFVAIAAAALIAWQGESVPAQEEQGAAETSIQTQDPGQAQATGQMRKGYPGYRLRKLDEKQTMPEEQKNRITLIIEDEKKQLKALSEKISQLKKEGKQEEAERLQRKKEEIVSAGLAAGELLAFLGLAE